MTLEELTKKYYELDIELTGLEERRKNLRELILSHKEINPSQTDTKYCTITISPRKKFVYDLNKMATIGLATLEPVLNKNKIKEREKAQKGYEVILKNCENCALRLPDKNGEIQCLKCNGNELCCNTTDQLIIKIKEVEDDNK